MNRSSWGSLLPRLRESHAWILLSLVTRLPLSHVVGAREQAAHLGWASFWSGAFLGDDGPSSDGLALAGVSKASGGGAFFFCQA